MLRSYNPGFVVCLNFYRFIYFLRIYSQYQHVLDFVKRLFAMPLELSSIPDIFVVESVKSIICCLFECLSKNKFVH